MKLKTYSERKMMRKSQMIKESGDYVSAIKSLVDDFEDVKKTIKNSTVTAFEVWLELGVKSGAIKEKDAKKLMNQMIPESANSKTSANEAKASDFAFFDVMFALSHAAKNGMIEADEKTIDKVIGAIPGNRIKVDALKKILADHGFGEKADELIAFTEKLVNGASADDVANESASDNSELINDIFTGIEASDLDEFEMSEIGNDFGPDGNAQGFRVTKYGPDGDKDYHIIKFKNAAAIFSPEESKILASNIKSAEDVLTFINDAVNESLEDGEMDVKQLAKSYGVKLLPADIEELGETTSREKFKEYFNIPDDADEDPNYRRDEAVDRKIKGFPFVMYWSDGMAQALGGDTYLDLVNSANAKSLKSFAIFKQAAGFHSTTQENYLVAWYDQDGTGYWSNRAKKEPELNDRKLNDDFEMVNESETETEVKPTHICIVDLKDGVDATPFIPEGAKVHISDDLVVEDIESGFTCDIDEQELEINFEPIGDEDGVYIDADGQVQTTKKDFANEAAEDEETKSDGGEPSEEAVAALEDEIEQALKAVINDLPKELKTIADGGELELAPNFDKEASKELNEAVGALIAGGVLALPAITQILGKTVKWAGAKLGSDDVQSWGKAIEHVGHGLHHKYEKLIDKILSPLTKHMDPEKRVIANKLVFYSLVAVLGGAGIAGAVKAAGAGHAGLAAVESGLSSVKVSELVAAAKEVIPRVLGNLMKAA